MKRRLHDNKLALYILYAVAAIAILLSALTHTTFLIIALSVALFSIFTPLPEALKRLLSARILIGLLVSFTFMQLFAVLFFFIGMRSGFLPITTACLLSALVLATFITKRGTYPAIPKPQRTDLLVLLTPLLLTVFIWSRTILPPKNDDISIVQSISFGMDDSTHSSIFGDILRSQGGLFASESLKESMALKWHAGYPMGWHIATAATASSLSDTRNLSVIDNVKLYYWSKVFSLFIALLALSILLQTLVSMRSRKEKSSAFLATLLVVSALSIGTLLILPLFYEGFFSFLPIIAYTALFAAILVSRKKQEQIPDLALASLTVASAITWMITAPILLLAYLHLHYTDGSWKHKQKRLLVALYGIAMALAIAAQVVLYRVINNDRSVESLAEAGGIMAPEHLLLVLCLGIYGFFLIRNKDKDGTAQRLFPIVGATSLALLGVLAVIAIKSPTISYYYYKLQSLLLILLVCFLLALFAEKLAALYQKRVLGAIELFAIFTISIGLAIPGVIGYDYFRNILVRTKDYGISDQIAQNLLEKPLNRNFKLDNSRYVYYFTGKAADTILASNLARSSYHSNSCDGSIFSSAYAQNYDQLVENIKRCANELPALTIVTDDTTYDTLKSDIGQSVNLVRLTR